jgi:hypothetical protein
MNISLGQADQLGPIGAIIDFLNGNMLPATETIGTKLISAWQLSGLRSQGWQKHIARNEVTIGKLQKGVEQAVIRGMCQRDSEISRLKIEVDNQRGQLKRANKMVGVAMMFPKR